MYSFAARRTTLEEKLSTGLTKAWGLLRNAHLNEGHKLADQEPDVEQLEVGGGGEDLPHVDDDGGQHQHCGQVHTQGSFKEGRFEEHEGIVGKKAIITLPKKTFGFFLTALL